MVCGYFFFSLYFSEIQHPSRAVQTTEQYSGQKTQRQRLFYIQTQYVTSLIQRQSVTPTGVSWELARAALCSSS